MDASIGFINPADLPVPTEQAVGEWRCGCGAVSFSELRSSVPISLLLECSRCGTCAEVLPLPLAAT